MPTYVITAPDGKEYEITAPEGATQEQVLEYAKSNYKQAGSSAAPYGNEGYKKPPVGDAVPKQKESDKPSVMDKMFGAGSPIARFVKGAVVDPALGVNQLLARLPIFPDEVKNQADQFVKKYEAMTTEERKKLGSEGFDWYQLLGAVASPVNKLIPSTAGTGVATKVGQGAAAGALYGGAAPTVAGSEEDFAAEKAIQMAFGGVVGGAIPLTIETSKALVGFIRGLPLSEAAKQRALTKYLGDMIPEGERQNIVAALRNAPEIVPGSKPTVGEALADIPGALSLQREQARLSQSPFTATQMVQRQREQQAARQGLLQSTFGTAEDLAGAEAERARVTAPLREEALMQANVYGQTAPRLEAELAAKMGQAGQPTGMIGALQTQGQLASEAVQAMNRANTWTPVPGMPMFPGRYSPNFERAAELTKAADLVSDVVQQRKLELDFKKLQLDSLKNEGFYPLSTRDLTTRIDNMLSKPGSRSNELLTTSLAAVKSKLEKYTDPQTGIIDSRDLYNIRKEVASDIGAFLASKGQQGMNTEAANADKAIKAMIDESINKAAGTKTWTDYLSNFAKYSEKINQMQVGQELQNKLGANLGDVEKAGVFSTAVNNAAGLIKRKTGQQRFDNLEDFLTTDQISSVNKVMADLNRKVKAEIASKQVKGAPEKPFSGVEDLPSILSRPVVIARGVLETLRKGSQRQFDAKVAELMLDPQKMASFLDEINKPQAKGVAEAMMAKLSPEMGEKFRNFVYPVSEMTKDIEGRLTRGLTTQIIGE